MKSKTKRSLKWLPSVLASLIISTGAVMKLAAQPQLAQSFSKSGLLPYMKILGLAELLFVGLFLWARSSRIGLFLLTAYFGGAIAIELSQQMVFITPAIMLGVLWLAAWLRDTSLFTIPQQKKTAAA